MDDSASRDDVEDGLRNLLRNLIETRLVQADLGATLKALVETLIASGALEPERFERRRKQTLDTAVERLHTRPAVQFGEAVDKYALEDLPQIDCAERLPICQARCCKFTVCLSAQDLDDKVFNWDYAKPYQIRKKEDGYCAHSEAETHRCSVYGHRPATCRTYDCRNDRRIWIDFERRIPA
jgi:hypothetical protein